MLILSALFYCTDINAATDNFIINDKMDDIQLSEYISYYEDISGIKTLDDIIKLGNSGFIPLNKKNVNIGYSSSVFWMKLIVTNEAATKKTWFIESQYPLLDYISLYLPAVFGYNEIVSGDRLSFSTMPYGYFNFLSKVNTEPGKSTIYIRIKSEGSIIAKFRAWDETSFINNMFYSIALLWLFYGIMFALLLYNFFIFISTKDRAYLALTLFIASSLFFTLVHNGMARKYLWPDMIWWGNYSHPFFIFTGIITLLWFTQLYLNTKINLPLSNKVLKLIIIIFLPMTVVSLFIPYSVSTKLSVIMAGIISAYIILFTMIPMFRVNRRLAVYYTCSWFFFAFGDVLLSLRSYGIINESFFATWSFQISMAAGIVFFSVGVADKLNTLRKENINVIETLRESEERYRLFFETAHDAIIFFIAEKPVYANRNMIRMSGFPEENFYTINIYDLFPDNDYMDTDIRNVINKISKGELSHSSFEYILSKMDGERINVLISLSSIATGKTIEIFMIISDISSMKRASLTIKEQYNQIQAQLNKFEMLNRELISAQDKLVTANSDLEKEKEYLSATLTSIGDGVISYNTEGRIFLINRVAEELTGCTSSRAIGKDIREILKLSDDASRDLLFETLGTVKEKYNFSNIGIPFRLPGHDGNERIVEFNSSVIRLHDRPLGIVLAMRDITIKSRIDNELIKMSKLESIGILAGGIAHDFNNLLTGISANISLLNRTKDLNPDLSDSLGDVEKAVKRATALTKQLLTFAKGGNPVMTICRLEDIIKESVKFIVKNSAIKTGITFDENIPSVLIDPNQISQAINNLLINAIQAMPDGGNLTITVKNSCEIPPEIPLKTGDYILITISDTGCGIPAKNLNKIFDPFFTTKSNGTGFGLTSTYSIIKKHRGYIRVNSVPEKGTTFEIFLKASGDEPESSETGIKNVSISSGGSVLIMDDEDYILEVLLKMLNYHGFSVSTAKNGEEAVNLYKHNLETGNPFNYVILDLTVYNGLGGKETVEILREIDPDVRAIVSSGYSDNPVLANYREYGFSGILSKPYAVEDVLRAIRES